MNLPLQADPATESHTSGALDTATIELLAAWRRQDETRDPEQVRAAERDLAEFKQEINRSRADAGAPLLYP